MIRKYISNAGFFCLLIALLMALILLIVSILQELFNILQECVVFEDNYMIIVALLVILGIILSIVGEVIIKSN